MVDIQKKVLTTHEVAKYLNVITNTVIHWMNTGKLKGYRTPGGHRRIPKEELIRFIKANNMEDCIKIQEAKKILIIEDDEDAMDFYTNVLDSYEIKKAYTGFSSGIAIEYKPDLVILDIMLPDFDGFKICDMLRKNKETATTKILVVSAITDSEKIDEIKKLGADDYLKKPFSIIELKDRIKNLLNN